MTDYASFTAAQHHEQLQNIIHPEQRIAYIKTYVQPQVVDLGTAENFLLLHFLQEKAFSNLPTLGLGTARYPIIAGGQPYNGGAPHPDKKPNVTILDGVAKFLSTQWGVNLTSANLYGSPGVIAAVELIALALFNPGDVVLLPAPLFYGFLWSLSQKTVQMQFVPFPIDNGNNLTVANVQAALAQNPNAKLLLLTNPNNPLGNNYPKDLLEQIYALFLSDPNRHIISDEIYANSQVGDPKAFVSALALQAYQKFPNQIHVTWGLSKDFGLAGFRAGFFVSNNANVKQAMSGGQCGPIPSWYASAAWMSPLVTLQPYVLQKLFFDKDGNADASLANQAMTEYRGLLKQQYNLAAKALDQGGISYYKQNQGALFFWLDLSKYLDLVPKDPKYDKPLSSLCSAIYKNDDPREQRLLNYIQQAGNVILVRGQETFNTAPGFFRLCYTATQSQQQLSQGLSSMIAALKKLG